MNGLVAALPYVAEDIGDGLRHLLILLARFALGDGALQTLGHCLVLQVERRACWRACPVQQSRCDVEGELS